MNARDLEAYEARLECILDKYFLSKNKNLSLAIQLIFKNEIVMANKERDTQSDPRSSSI